MVTLVNMWGTLKSDIDTESGYCAECERENWKHYESCPVVLERKVQALYELRRLANDQTPTKES